MEKGLVHIYCGNGKGKTTAAAGLAVRAAGQGMRVLFTQFLKDYTSGEVVMLEGIDGIDIFRGKPVEKFVFAMNDEEKAALAGDIKAQFEGVFAEAEKYDLLILDEALDIISMGFVSEDEAAELLKSRPQGLEVVLTGREFGEKLRAAADYISEINPVKHPFDKGISARKGIEF